MPTYDFKCDRCDEVQIIHASIQEEVKPRCTRCDKLMTRVFSSPPIKFIGSGWASKDK
jgi:putative FmdB family regulatory protein